MDVTQISKKMKALDGICDEAAELLKDYTFSPNICGHLRRLKPARQIERVELMIPANHVSSTYAMALLAATPAQMPVSERKPRRVGKLDDLGTRTATAPPCRTRDGSMLRRRTT